MNFVTWKWAPATGNRAFQSEHVNVLRAMLERNFHAPHKLICLTDDTGGLDPRIEALPLPVTGFEHLPNPSSKLYPRMEKDFPSCYRRLWVFSDEARSLGERIICIDIDVIVTGDITHLAKKTAPFVGWSSAKFGWNKIAGGLYMLTPGAHTEVWTEFDPDTSPRIAAAAGNNGSDQAWMSYKLYPPKEMWTDADGVVKINWLSRRPPNRQCLVFTNGHRPPWDQATQKKYPWVSRYWRE